MTKQFKCWDKQENKWATIDINHWDYSIVPARIRGKDGEIFELSDDTRFTWVESTGFLDKNGKMIFNGDLVHVINNRTKTEALCRVEWHESYGAWVYYYINRHITEDGYIFDGAHGRLIPVGNGILEVLGNIYEDLAFNEYLEKESMGKRWVDVPNLFKKFKNYDLSNNI